MNLSGFGVAYALGVSLAAPPGPINMLMFSEAVRNSRWSAFSIGLGALSADAIFYALVSTLRSSVLNSKIIFLLYPIGCAVLLYLSFLLVKGANAKQSEKQVKGVKYIKGLGVGLTNPLQIGWWTTVGLPLASIFGVEFALGFFSGILSWVLGFTSMVSLYRERLVKAFKVISYASAAVLCAFALYFALLFLSALTA